MTSSWTNLSLKNTVCSVDQALRPPSVEDGLSRELELDFRIFGCDFINSMGILLRLPQVAIATAQILFQRFYFTTSFRKTSVRSVILGSLFLACKLEESPRKVRDFINAYGWLDCRNRQKVFNPVEYTGSIFYELKNDMFQGEILLLTRLGFNVHVQHPYGFMINYLQALGMTAARNVGTGEGQPEEDKSTRRRHETSQMAWSILNDSLRTPIHTFYQPSTIAVAVIYLSALINKMPLPTNPQWYECFDATREEVEEVLEHILSLYYDEQTGGDATTRSESVRVKRRVKRWLPVTLVELEEFIQSGYQFYSTGNSGRRIVEGFGEVEQFVAPPREAIGKVDNSANSVHNLNISRRGRSRSPSQKRRRSRSRSRDREQQRARQHRDERKEKDRR